MKKAHQNNGSVETTEETIFDAIKTRYVEGLHACAKAEGNLTEIVYAAFDELSDVMSGDEWKEASKDGGIAKRTAGKGNTEKEVSDLLIDWGIEAGYSESWVRTLISRVRIEATGKRLRKKGAGRKAPVDAKGVAERAVKQFGSPDKAMKILLAAYRLLKKQAESGPDTDETDEPQTPVTRRIDFTPEAERLVAKSGNGKH